MKQDFLSAAPGRLKVDAVVANPPFVSYHRMAMEQRESVLQWRKMHGAGFPLTASLWAYFLVHSMAFLKEGGRMAFVLPAAAIRSDYAAPVMAKVAARFAGVRVFRVEEQLFLQEGAEERAVVLLAEGYERGKSQVPDLKAVKCLSDLKVAMEADLPATHEESVGDASELLVQRLHEAGHIQPMEDVASISIGEVIGDTRFFVRPSKEWQELGIPATYLRPLLTRSQQIKGRLRIASSDVDSHALPLLLYPGSQVRSAKVKNYLATYPVAKRDSNVTFGKRQIWHNATYATSADAFLPSMSHGSPRVILNSAGVSCANGFYKLHAKAGVPWRASIAAASLTAIFRWSAESHGRPMGAGAMKVEPSDARRMLLPISIQQLTGPISAQLLHDLEKLLKAGMFEQAADLADRVLLLEPKLVTDVELNTLRRAIHLSQHGRMQRTNHGIQKNPILSLDQQ